MEGSDVVDRDHEMERLRSWSRRNDELVDTARAEREELEALVAKLLNRLFGPDCWPAASSDPLWIEAVKVGLRGKGLLTGGDDGR